MRKTMGDASSIKHFVQNVLGCTCPDIVFEQIEDRAVASPLAPYSRSITIGKRLLVYICKVGGPENLQTKIFSLLETGRKERDDRGLNRFRLVLAAEDPGQIAVGALLCFSRFTDRDERMHIHVIATHELPALYPEAAA